MSLNPTPTPSRAPGNRRHRAHRWSPTLAVAAVVAVAAALAAAPVRGQEEGVGRIAGQVFDSTAVRGLVNALVYLEGTEIQTRTDRTGAFLFDSLRPGEYRVNFRHPRAAFLGVEPEGIRVVVDPGISLRVSLALPSLEGIRSEVCTSDFDPALPGFLRGNVRDGSAEMPVALAGAVVEGSWAVDGSVGQRRTITDQTGQYTLCDLPVGVEIGLRAGQGREISIPTSITLDDGTVPRRNLRIYPRTRTRIVGQILDFDSRDPVEGAVVRLAGTGRTTVTGNSGRFLLDDVNVGRYRFEVEHLTYGITADSIEVGASTADVEVLLSPQAIQLEGITVFARPAPLENVGFYDRQVRSVGRFISRHDILRRKPNRLSEMLQAVPGVQLTVGQFTDYGVLLRNRCEPTYLVDGQHYPRQIFRVDDLHPSLIHGIEIYLSPAQIPAEYRQPQWEAGGTTPESPCGVILIWTGPGHWDPSGGAEDS